MLGVVNVAETVRISAAQEMAGFASWTQSTPYVSLKSSWCLVTLGNDALNRSRGELPPRCEEDHYASGFVTGESDEGKHGVILVGLVSLRSGLSGHFDSPLFCIRSVGSPGFFLGCVSVSKIETFFFFQQQLCASISNSCQATIPLHSCLQKKRSYKNLSYFTKKKKKNYKRLWNFRWHLKKKKVAQVTDFRKHWVRIPFLQEYLYWCLSVLPCPEWSQFWEETVGSMVLELLLNPWQPR